MISQTAEYALREIVFLSMNSSSAFTTKQIAAATKFPPAYLSKIMQALVRGNLVQSQRDCGGGVCTDKAAYGDNRTGDTGGGRSDPAHT
ncbi:MAG: Rrf2 family transcriptional regulator [Candidatus Obscuribacterales bacterium]|nr:Rrf2 family transcriptional regulator [Candidatus Obscuribacterales bacterium]